MSKPYFEPEHKVELKRIFTEIADFIHEHGLQQVVTAGPSAAPFSKAIQRAYANRHGGKLSSVNLGRLGERLGEIEYPREQILEHLRKHKPGFDLNKRTLLFDEMTSSGVPLLRLSGNFAQIGVPHKTAVILYRRAPRTDYGGLDIHEDFCKDIAYKVYVKLSRKLGTRYNAQSFRPFITTLKRELAEIADSVPRKE